LRRVRSKRRQRRFGERSSELERKIDQRLEIGTGRLACERVLENRRDRDAPQRRRDGSAVLAADFLDKSDGLSDVHAVLPPDIRLDFFWLEETSILSTCRQRNGALA